MGSGNIAPRLIHLDTWLKYVVTSNLPPVPWEGTPTSIENDASWPHEELGTLCITFEYIPPSGIWNTIRRSASTHPPPAAGVNKLPAISAVPLVQVGPRARPCGICDEQSNIKRDVS